MKDKQLASTSVGTEGGRLGPTGVPAEVNGKPDPEVVVQMTRRRINNSYKLKVLNHVDSLRDGGNGAIGAYLRKEGLYYSMVQTGRSNVTRAFSEATAMRIQEKKVGTR